METCENRERGLPSAEMSKFARAGRPSLGLQINTLGYIILEDAKDAIYHAQKLFAFIGKCHEICLLLNADSIQTRLRSPWKPYSQQSAVKTILVFLHVRTDVGAEVGGGR